MRYDSIEFIVDHWDTADSGRLTVVGRCGNAPVPVGKVFDVIYRNKPRRYPDESGDEPIREKEVPVELRVVCAHAYGKSLSCLGQGMTGSLVLEGDGLRHVVSGWILGRHDPSRSPASHEVPASTSG